MPFVLVLFGFIIQKNLIHSLYLVLRFGKGRRKIQVACTSICLCINHVGEIALGVQSFIVVNSSCTMTS